MKIKEISPPNAALKIEIIELSEQEQKTLMTNVDYIKEGYLPMPVSESNTQKETYVDPYLTLGKLSGKLPLLAEAISTRTSEIQEYANNEKTAIHINIFPLASKFIQLSIWSSEPEVLFFYIEGYDSPIETAEMSTKNLGQLRKFLNFFKAQYEKTSI